MIEEAEGPRKREANFLKAISILWTSVAIEVFGTFLTHENRRSSTGSTLLQPCNRSVNMHDRSTREGTISAVDLSNAAENDERAC